MVTLKGKFSSTHRFTDESGDSYFLAPLKGIEDYPLNTELFILLNNKTVIDWMKVE
jgi:hypothetical protein